MIRAVSLMYHDLYRGKDIASSGFDEPLANSMKVEVSVFEGHLKRFFDSQEVQVNLITDLIDKVHIEENLLLTFDDGGVSAFEFIAPILEKFGLLGHFFITTSKIGASGFMNENQIKALADKGHVIGSHSHSHPYRMSFLDEQQILDEWKRSKDILEKIIGNEIEAASVPGGFYSKKVGAIAALSGFKYLFTSEPVLYVDTVKDCSILGRYLIKSSDSIGKVMGLVTAYYPYRPLQYLTWNFKKLLKRILGRNFISLQELLYRNV